MTGGFPQGDASDIGMDVPHGGRARRRHPLLRRLGYDLLASAVTGGIGGLLMMCLIFAGVLVVPMVIRRQLILSLPLASRTSVISAGTPIPDTGTSERLPQIDWDLVMTDEEATNRQAIRNDIRTMRDVPGTNIVSWPTLPYAMSDWESDERFPQLIKLVDSVYSDEPELSVYTNGQSLSVCAAISKYRLMDGDEDSAEDNRREYEEVKSAVDSLHWEIEDAVRSHGLDLWPRECSEDEMYVILLYERLASMATYSDGHGDSEHANDIYGALFEGEAKCYGISSAAQALLLRRGIPSFMASGSAEGSPDKRHAWVTLWIDGQWKVLDITNSQGEAPPKIVNTDAATSGAAGYWGGCMVPFDEFVESWDMEVDDVCLDLMRAYEQEIGVR